MANITFLAGDFQGSAGITPEFMVHHGMDILNCRIPLAGNVHSIEKATEESIKRIGGALGWGIVGGAVFGGVGAIAGLVLGGKTEQEITVICTLKDGRTFLGTTDTEGYKNLLTAQMTIHKAPVKSIEQMARETPNVSRATLFFIAFAALILVMVFLK